MDCSVRTKQNKTLTNLCLISPKKVKTKWSRLICGFSTAECTDQRKLLIVIVLMLQQQASWILPVLLGIAPYQFVCQVWWAHVITSYYVYKVNHSIISGITLWLCYDTYGRLLVYWSSATPSYWNDSYIFDAIAWTN